MLAALSAHSPTQAAEAADILKKCGAHFNLSRLAGFKVETDQGDVYISSQPETQVRVETTMPVLGDTAVTVLDKQAVVTRLVPGGRVRKVNTPFAANLPVLFDSFREVSLIGNDTIQGKPYYKVQVGDFRPAWYLFGLLNIKPLSTVTATLWIGKTDYLLRRIEADVHYAQADLESATYVADLEKYGDYQGVKLPQKYTLTLKDAAAKMTEQERSILSASDYSPGSPAALNLLHNYDSLKTYYPDAATLHEKQIYFKELVQGIWTVERTIQKEVVAGKAGLEINMKKTAKYAGKESGFFEIR